MGEWGGIRRGRERAATTGARWVWVLLVAFGLSVGCGEREKKKPKNLFSERPKIDYSQVKVPKPPPRVVEKPQADTWATGIQRAVKAIHEDVVKCRNDFMLPFQFNKMRRRDVMWLAQNEMDKVCREGDPAAKKRGVWKTVLWLSKEEIGKHPDLDRFIALTLDTSEHFRTLSLMGKKVGAPDIAVITDTAKSCRDRVVAAGADLDRAAQAIAAWPPDTLPHDDPQMVAKPLDVQGFKKMLDDHYGFFLGDMVGAYERFANKSWQFPNMIKFKSYRAWADIPTKHMQQDRARLAKVQGLDDKGREALTGYLDAVDGVLKAWRDSYARYMDSKSDTWDEKDPWLKPLVKAQQSWQKLHDKIVKAPPGK